MQEVLLITEVQHLLKEEVTIHIKDQLQLLTEPIQHQAEAVQPREVLPTPRQAEVAVTLVLTQLLREALALVQVQAPAEVAAVAEVVVVVADKLD